MKKVYEFYLESQLETCANVLKALNVPFTEEYNKTRPITSHDLIIDATEETHRDIDKLLGYALKITGWRKLR